jgi:hypothetical protein
MQPLYLHYNDAEPTQEGTYFMRRLILPVTAAVALPLLLSACGSASTSAKTAHLSPKEAVAASYHKAGSSATSFHLDETATVSINKKVWGETSVSGNIYSDPSNPSASDASLVSSYSTLGKSSGSVTTLAKGNTVYVNADALHLSGVKINRGWVKMPLSSFRTNANHISSSSADPILTTSAQSSFLKVLLHGGKFTSDGASTFGGKPVNVYTASMTLAQFSHSLSSTTGQLAKSLLIALSLTNTKTGALTFTIDVGKNNGLVAGVKTSFSSLYAPTKGSSTKYHFVLAVQQKYSDYGVSFTVHKPTGARSITSFSAI